MAIVLDKVIIRDAGNTINTSTNYSELNVKAEGLIDDLVANIEGNAATQEAYINTSVNTMTTQIASLIDPTGTGYTTEASDVKHTALSKAGFNAIARDNRDKFAGSGFVEFGKHDSAVGLAVNEGMNTRTTTVNGFYMGRDLTAIGGVSKTPYPLVNINGILQRLYKVNSLSNYDLSLITLPPAPTVLPYDATLTQQQIDSGVIKHADASNSGLIVNGKFDTDTAWTKGAGWSIAGGVLTATSVVTSVLSQTIPTVIGKKYIIELNVNSISSDTFTIKYGNVNFRSISGIGRKEVSFTATESSTIISIVAWAGTNLNIEIDNIAVFPADAISRSDLCFIESWHEDVSEKDFVYPLGNVQYLGTTGDSGTPVVGAFAGSATYSLFSDTWQADSALIGKGYVWSTLSDANKKAFVANPENNCYLDGYKVIQVRYRMRVVMGMSDSFDLTTLQTEGTSTFRYSGNSIIQAKGKNVSTPIDIVESGFYI